MGRRGAGAHVGVGALFDMRALRCIHCFARGTRLPIVPTDKCVPRLSCCTSNVCDECANCVRPVAFRRRGIIMLRIVLLMILVGIYVQAGSICNNNQYGTSLCDGNFTSTSV